MKKSLFETALDRADTVMDEVSSSMLERPTPCSEWDMRQLLNHVYNELAWVPELLAGKTIEQVGTALDGDLVGSDLHHAWRAYAAAARESAAKAPPESVVHLSYGNVPAIDYLDEMGAEITVHTWDIAQAAGLDFHIDPGLAEVVYDYFKQKSPAWRAAGLMGKEKPASSAATIEAKLLRLCGRSAYETN